ncbi:MAG: hypothetical protein ACLGI5_08175 [Thermoleophilia bacterium]
MSDGVPEAQDRLTELRASAKGWHGIQLAALGFIGLCGVIETGDSTNPWTLQVMSGVLVLVAFALACAGIYLVGRAAWPLYRGDPQSAPRGAGAVEAASRQLTRGLVLTFLSIAALALATAASWWPKEADGAGAAQQVRVQTADGATACGELRDAPQPGRVRIAAGSRTVDVALASLASIAPTADC